MLERIRVQRDDPVIRPLLKTGKAYYILAGIMLILVLWFGYAWIKQLINGLILTDMRTPVGAAWGVYISNFVFFACIAHGGMAISAIVRLFNQETFKPVARMGEALTIIALILAGVSIVIDLGRPDRAMNMFLYFPERLTTSPLTWDLTVIILYFTLSSSYLWLTIRKDLAHYVSRFEKRGIIYKFLLIGYHPDQEAQISKIARWLSVALLVLIVMLSGGVIPWIFGLQAGRPGWFGAMAGPYFLTAALATSIAAVIIIAAVLRRTYKWHEIIKTNTFKWLSVLLGLLTHLYIYLTVAELITMRYEATHAESAVSEILISGEFSPLYWTMLIVGLALPGIALLFQMIRPRWFSIKITVISSIIILIAFWIKRFLIVVPSLLRPLLPFPSGTYQPSWVEWSIVVGIFALAVLLYMIFIKVFPILETDEK